MRILVRRQVRTPVVDGLLTVVGRRGIIDLHGLNGKEVNFGLARPDALTLTEVRYDHLKFNEPSHRYYGERLEEELFTDSIRKDFFDSL